MSMFNKSFKGKKVLTLKQKVSKLHNENSSIKKISEKLDISVYKVKKLLNAS